MAAERLITGNCQTGFGAVAEAFGENFAERDEIGAAVAVVVAGEPVVDLWGGWMDRSRSCPWREDAIVNVWSVGKPFLAVSLFQLMDAGKVELEAPVARYWPEFAQAGKDSITVRQVLNHSCGLPAIGKPLPAGFMLTSWEGMVEAIAEQAPWWEPGTRFGYHVNTFGFLIGELIRRVDGRRYGTYVREEIAEKHGIDFLAGFGPEHDARVAEWAAYVAPPDEPSQRPWLDQDPATLSGVDLARYMAYRNPAPLPGTDMNSRVWRAAEYPATNPHSNARAVARFYGALATSGMLDTGRLVSSESIERANTIESDGEDAMLMRPNRFGLGFQLTIPGVRPLGPGPRAFGHYGNGAVLGFADPDAGVGFAYVCNRAGRSWRDPRNIALVDALYTAMGQTATAPTG